MVGAHQVSPDGGRNKGLASSSHRDQNEYKEVADAAAEEGQGLSEEDESKINEAVGGLNHNQIGDAVPPEQQSGGLQKQQQQQSPGPIIRWERFLPIRTLKILLVEYDDSTRQVVSALLRNCSYEASSTKWRDEGTPFPLKGKCFCAHMVLLNFACNI